jgi:phospholipid/cholesterol/gamma-HCH transport system substrate-binding protein
MPQRKQITWAQLRVGTLVIISLTILVIGIFLISGEVGFLSRKYTLKTYFSGAGGLRPGSQVRVAGIPVGTVTDIQLSGYSEPDRAVEVRMRVPRDFQSQIRPDSAATLATAGLLGEAYVDITRGSAAQPPIPNGGEVKSREEADIKRIVQNTNDVISNLRVVSGKLSDITDQIQSGQGSIGKMIYNESLYNNLNQSTATISRLVARIDQGEGTLGKLMTDETLYQHTVGTLDHVNQLVDDVQHGKGTIAKFIADPSVYDHVNQLVARANTLIGNVNNGQGTLGKLATDDQFYTRLNDTFSRLNVITTRIEQGEGTIGKLSTDPTLYNNLSASSTSLKEFLTEFRQSPKKYLTIRLRLF